MDSDRKTQRQRYFKRQTYKQKGSKKEIRLKKTLEENRKMTIYTRKYMEK